MHELPRPVRVAVFVFVLVDIAIIFLMTFFGGLARKPLQELPLIYWVLLFSLPLLFLAIALFVNPDPLATNMKNVFGSPKTDAAVQSILFIFSSIGAFFLSLVFYLLQPQWGGNTALFAAIGCMLLATAFVYYRRYRFLKNVN